MTVNKLTLPAKDNAVQSKVNEIVDNFADKDLSNLTATGEKHFLNKTQITNCILEAPNGTHTVSGSTITLKAGLKVLMPIGRNTNGTMNNIEYAIPSDISFTYPFSIYIPKDFIWVELNGTIGRLQAEFVYYINWYSELAYTGNNQYRLAYVAQDNLWYFTSDTGNTWTSRTICPVGYATIETDNTISALSIYGTARIFTQNDSAAISRFSLPTYYNIGLAIGASGTTYTAPANGYFYVGWHALGIGQWALLYNATTGMDSNVVRSAGGATDSAWWYRCHMPARQGDVVYLTYDAAIDFVSFHYMSYIDREIR